MDENVYSRLTLEAPTHVFGTLIPKAKTEKLLLCFLPKGVPATGYFFCTVYYLVHRKFILTRVCLFDNFYDKDSIWFT